MAENEVRKSDGTPLTEAERQHEAEVVVRIMRGVFNHVAFRTGNEAWRRPFREEPLDG